MFPAAPTSQLKSDPPIKYNPITLDVHLQIKNASGDAINPYPSKLIEFTNVQEFEPPISIEIVIDHNIIAALSIDDPLEQVFYSFSSNLPTRPSQPEGPPLIKDISPHYE